MGLFSIGKELNTRRLITLEQAMRYQKDEKYKAYIFPVEEMKNGKMMCRPQLKVEVIVVDKQEEKRRKRNDNLAHIYNGGKYRGIDKNVSTRQTRTRENRVTKYNDWQSAKKYNAESYQR